MWLALESGERPEHLRRLGAEVLQVFLRRAGQADSERGAGIIRRHLSHTADSFANMHVFDYVWLSKVSPDDPGSRSARLIRAASTPVDVAPLLDGVQPTYAGNLQQG